MCPVRQWNRKKYHWKEKNYPRFHCANVTVFISYMICLFLSIYLSFSCHFSRSVHAVWTLMVFFCYCVLLTSRIQKEGEEVGENSNSLQFPVILNFLWCLLIRSALKGSLALWPWEGGWLANSRAFLSLRTGFFLPSPPPLTVGPATLSGFPVRSKGLWTRVGLRSIHHLRLCL